MRNETTITKDAANKQLTVKREFAAPLPQVWKAWTDSSILDQWWAPRPWKANTEKMNFTEGGMWLYYMQGPKGEKQWCRADFMKIEQGQYFMMDEYFSDEKGNRMPEPPGSIWKNDFTPTEKGTLVTVVLTFENEADMDKIVNMGFKEGFTAAHGNLDELLASMTTPQS